MDNLKRDFDRVYKQTGYKGHWRKVLHTVTSPSFQAVACYRFTRWLMLNKIPLIGIMIQRLAEVWTGISIPPETEIGPGLLILHQGGIVIHAKVVLGEDCVLHHNVTIGNRNPGGSAPVLGDRVMVGVGAAVLGEIKIGNDCEIGANSVVLKDLPERSVAVGIPAQVIRTKSTEGAVRG